MSRELALRLSIKDSEFSTSPEVGRKDRLSTAEARLSREVMTVLARKEQDMYLLPRTGFNVRDQVQQLKHDVIQGALRGENIPTICDGWLKKTEQDIQGFKVEYLCEGPLFPIVLEYKVVNGEKRIIAPLYNEKLLTDTVSDKERLGKVKEAICGENGVEKFLLNARAGEMAVMTSPAGWSGLTDSTGRQIVYPDSQTYLWQKQPNGSIRGFTVKTDMTLYQNEELLEQLGITKQQLGYSRHGEEWINTLSARNQVCNIVGNVAYLPSGKSIEDIVKTIQDIKKSDVAFADTTGRKRTFQEIFQTLRNPEVLWTLDDETRNLTQVFSLFVRRQLHSGHITKEIIQTIETALGMTILQLASLIRSEFSSSRKPPLQILGIIQQLAGCNGGGTLLIGSISPRLVSLSNPASSETCIKIKCRKCGWTPDMQEEKELAEGKLKSCPGRVTNINEKTGEIEKKPCGWTPEKAA